MGMSYAARRSQVTVKTFVRISLNYKKSAQCLRTPSPEPPVAESDSREAIYLKLLQGSTGLNQNEVFQGAPPFFKRKIGLKEGGFEPRNSRRVALESKAPPSNFRLRNCTGCSSSTQLQEADAGDAPCFRRSAEPLPSRRASIEFNDNRRHNSPATPAVSSDCRLTPKKPEWINVWNKASSIKANEQAGSFTTANRALPAHSERCSRVRSEAKEIRTVFVVNGNVVSLTGIGSEQFTNWFAQADMRDNRRRKNILRKLDFSGFSSREISLKLFEGRKFVIAGQKAGDSTRVKHAFKLPEDVEVESLFLSRDKLGFLIIETKVNIPQVSMSPLTSDPLKF